MHMSEEMTKAQHWASRRRRRENNLGSLHSAGGAGRGAGSSWYKDLTQWDESKFLWRGKELLSVVGENSPKIKGYLEYP